MTYETIAPAVGAEDLYTAFFGALSGNSFLLKTDAPKYTILAVTPQHLKLTGCRKEEFIGKGVFEVFPANPNDPRDTGTKDFQASLNYVLQNKQPHELPVQRYDIADAQGHFKERYWRAESRPVLTPGGEVAYIIHTTEDITVQVQSGKMQERMKGMEQAYNLFMQMPIPICILKGPALLVEFANEPTLQLWGKSKEVIGLPLEDAVPEVKGQVYAGIIKEVRDTGKANQIYESPVTLIRNGVTEVAYINYIYEPYYEEDQSQAVGVLAIGSDVTDKVLAKKEVHESEQRFHNLVSDASIGIILLSGEQMKVEVVNESYARLVGRSSKDLYGQRLFDVVPEAEAAFRPNIDGVRRSGVPLHQNGAPYLLIVDGEKKEGFLNLVYQPYREADGTISGVMVLCQDITDQVVAQKSVEAANQEIRFVTDFVPQMIWVTRPDGYHYYYNKQWYDYTGLTYDESAGEGWNGVFHPDDQERAWKLWRHSLATGEPYEIEYRCRRFDGEYRWVLGRALPLRDGSGTILKWFGTCTDIHDQMIEAELLEDKVNERTKELQVANQELARSNVNLGEFAYAASHDLKEPIRKIHFFADRLKSTLSNQLTEEQVRNFERLETSAKRMSSLIDNLLSFSQVSFHANVDDEVDLNELIDVVLEDLDLEIEEKGATIEVERLFTVKGHQRQLQQAFHNLIGNALKYNKPGMSPKVRISCGKVSGNEIGLQPISIQEDRAFYCISVRDNGIGFEQADAERIFNVFTRLHGNSEYKGTGIGLSIVRKVVENHNGYIRAESVPGDGATFKIYFAV